MLSTLSATQHDLYFAVAAPSASWRLPTGGGTGGEGKSACCCESALEKKTPVACALLYEATSYIGGVT